ncbi:carcinoembryonic antigen-related cell adhesion molecule 1 [Megalops cyprinoides]|uniref:carcinoembryonic antigen-related cell adhesion molecule 1 n=1 Tax=Megalops cyprinoides TaxID=118141 RepID=UPI001864884A|nr:carcinoembryonic antigen-related cell adhesion molecule 1 [Megalops cyprinoides]
MKLILTFDASTGTLILKNVTLEDSGSYIIQGLSPSLRASATLSVQEPVSDVRVSANDTNLVEFNDTVSLTCSASGSSLSYRWHNGNTDITASERIQLSDNNKTLTISSVLRSDQGPLYCTVSNGISNGTSQPVLLNISYGPSNLKLTPNPSKPVYRAESDLVLRCSADSNPPAYYSWAFQGALINQKGPDLRLDNVQQSQSGNYTCWAHNDVTLRYASVTTWINIIEPISEIGVNASGKQPILNEPFTLSCEVSGPADSILWLKDGSFLPVNNRTTFSVDNSTVTFNPVQLSDDGDYQCEAYNAVSNGTSPKHQVLVNYGPEQPVITGPSLAVTGSTVTFNCTATSRPPSQYSWYFNGTRVAESSVYETGPLTSAGHRTYTCMAFNSVTGRNSTATKELNVISPVSPVTVSPSTSFPTLSSSLTLTCDVTGAANAIHWLKDGQILVPDNRTTFSVDNSTVTFNPVQLSDDGDYQCEAFNAVSNGTSPKYQVLVNYGPEEPVITGPSLAVTGSTVTFNCTATSRPPSQYSWYFNGTRVAESSVYQTGPLTSAGHRTYTCMAFNSVTGRNSTATKELNVISPVSPVTVSPSTPFPTLSSSLTLTCDVTGAANAIHWLKDGQILVPDNRTTFSVDNSTVTFNPVQLSDDGSYQCEAFNAVSNGTSPKYQVLVNYGPEEPVITGPSLAETGSTVTFNCTATSRPPSQYSWYFNGTRVAESSVYETGPLTSASQGTYTCMAFNSVTGRNSSAVKELTVIAPISSVMVIPSSSIPILSFNLTLTCDVSGVFNSIYWMKDGHVFSENENRTFSVDNSSVSFNPVQILDDGIYQCVASNSFSEKTSPGYKLLVSYGPDTPVIQGPHSVKAGFRVTLTCTAFSQPPSHYFWKFNNNTDILSTTNVLTMTASVSSAGHYTCVSRNPLTNVTATATFRLDVTEPSAAPGLLSSRGLSLTALLGLSVPLLTNWLSH